MQEHENKEVKGGNVDKYGDEKFDIIGRAFIESDLIGNWYCLLNAEKYIERFSRPSSSKSGNVRDLDAATNYIRRMKEHRLETLKKEK